MNNLTLGLAVVAGCTLGAIGGIVSDPAMRLNPHADWRSRLPAATSATHPQLSAAELSYPGPRWWVYGNKRYTAEDRWYGAEPRMPGAGLPDLAPGDDVLESPVARDVALEPTAPPEPAGNDRIDAQRAVAAALAATAHMTAETAGPGDAGVAESQADADAPAGH